MRVNQRQYTKSKTLKWIGISFIILAVSLSTPSVVGAQYATITVDTKDDDNIVNGNCTLREAILASNTNTAVDGCSAGSVYDTIAFNIPVCVPGCLFQLSSALPALTSGNTTIDGTTQPENTPGVPVPMSLSGSLIPAEDGFTIDSNGNEIRGFVIWSFTNGVVLDEDAQDNTIVGNTIYLNSAAGVLILSGAQNNTIGGGTPEDANNIRLNQYGVSISGGLNPSGTTGNVIIGNTIGTESNGLTDLGNSDAGVSIWNAVGNTIGGTTAGERNIISGNDQTGVMIWGSFATDNTVIGNIIGLDANEDSLGNSSSGVFIWAGAHDNTIGGATVGERNVLSGNTYYGIELQGSGVSGNIICGNYIGTDSTGMLDRGNGSAGVFIRAGALNNTVGGAAAGEGNLISGNDWAGVQLSGATSTNNTISGNVIGLKSNGTQSLGNDVAGVYITSDSSGNTIGGETAGTRNVVSGNGSSGVLISAGSGNTVSGNFIGTDSSGTLDLGNGSYGISVSGSGNTIGGTTAGRRNVISGNDHTGVSLTSSSATGNVIQGNFIGTTISGSSPLGNDSNGVSISNGAFGNTVGGSSPAERNIISANGSYGVYIYGTDTNNNTVMGNYIGTTLNGLSSLGNGTGVGIVNGAWGNTIGGNGPGARNVISSSSGAGIYIRDVGTSNNTVSGNFIGTDVNGTVDLGNASNGVFIWEGASNNTIGGAAEGERNLISGNSMEGVKIQDDNTSGNALINNYIGTDVFGTSDLGNSYEGVSITFSAHDNTVGPANIIAFNSSGSGGIDIGGDNNTITQNSIHDNPGPGIFGASSYISSPSIVSANCSGLVTGTSCASCVIEIFSDGSNEGKTYEGTTTANASGNFTWFGAPDGPNLTATATDSSGSTSNFSSPYDIGICNGLPADFDADGRSEIVIFRSGAWRFFDYVTASFDHGVWTGTEAGCIPAPMDYDGDGGVEPTQLCDGAWNFYNDDGTYNKGIWTGGVAGDLPVPGDYDGDGVDDVVVWRAGAWRFFDFATGAFDHGVWTGSPPHWLGGTNIPTPMDYDGDGKLDFTIFSGGPWHFYNHDGSYNKGIWTGGVAGDLPVPADYNRDGVEDVVVWRSGAWRFFDFPTGVFDYGIWTGAPAHWLGGTPLPAPVDYDGDGDVNFSVFSGGPWHFYEDFGAYSKGIWTGGVAGDLPISRRLLP